MKGTPLMESINAARSNQDVALDLLKFIASHANVGSKGTGSTGFGVTATNKPDEHVTQLLELYARCRTAVESPVDKK
jgi:hypothetical protein